MTMEQICSIPDPFRSLEEWERFTHQDLLRLSRPQLFRERERVRLRLLLETEPPEWLVLRLDALEEILA